jgi:3-oxoadipate enol-lactonase
MAERTVTSADGTPISAWDNGGTGPAVLLSNGLGVPPGAWPALEDPRCGFRVVSWRHRGLGGSPRPADPERRRVEHHTEDALAVLDAFELSRVLVVGWSVGVGVAFELARQEPERLRGVLAVAGAPGGSYESLFAPFGVPRRLRARTGRSGAQVLRVLGPLVPLVTASLPALGSPWPGLLGTARELAQLRAVRAVLSEFESHDWDWYADLAVASGEHPPVDLSAVLLPVTLLAGSSDTFVDVADLRQAAARLGDARYRELPGTHFLPLQYPAVMLEELRLLAGRADERDA